MAMKDDKDFEVATKGYAHFEEDGVFYRRKKPLFIGIDLARGDSWSPQVRNTLKEPNDG